MARFVGVKQNLIRIVSDHVFHSSELQIIPVPVQLEHLTDSELMLDCVFRDGQLKCKRAKKVASEMKVALVGNWKMRCGIATYSENLWPHIAQQVEHVKLFIEENDLPTSDIYQLGDQKLSTDQVSPCWKRGSSLHRLIEEIKQYDPDVVWIRHEFGLWPNAAYWLSLMTQLADYRVICTMHSVFHHRDKTIVEAAMPEIVVHLEGGRHLLKEIKGINGKVYVIPHGCYPLDDGKLWNFYKSNHTFMQFGFGFRYKGWQNSIRTTALLKEKYPDVFFTGLFSESPYAMLDHQVYYNELMSLVGELGIQDNVAILRGFQSDAVLDSFLRTNQAAIFPYVSSPEHEVFGASGAARMAMSKGLPVITSGVNHFSDLPTLKADTPEEMAAALDQIFSSPDAQQKQIGKQVSYVLENTWEKVAQRYVRLFEGCNY